MILPICTKPETCNLIRLWVLGISNVNSYICADSASSWCLRSNKPICRSNVGFHSSSSLRSECLFLITSFHLIIHSSLGSCYGGCLNSSKTTGIFMVLILTGKAQMALFHFFISSHSVDNCSNFLIL